MPVTLTDAVLATYQANPDANLDEIGAALGISMKVTRRHLNAAFAERAAAARAENDARRLLSRTTTTVPIPLGHTRKTMNRTPDQRDFCIKEAADEWRDRLLGLLINESGPGGALQGWDDPDSFEDHLDALHRQAEAVLKGDVTDGSAELLLAALALAVSRLRRRPLSPLDRPLRIERGVVNGVECLYSEGHHDPEAFRRALEEAGERANGEASHLFVVSRDGELETTDAVEAERAVSVAFLR